VRLIVYIYIYIYIYIYVLTDPCQGLRHQSPLFFVQKFVIYSIEYISTELWAHTDLLSVKKTNLKACSFCYVEVCEEVGLEDDNSGKARCS
jgi:hypothetical protein